MTPKEQQRASRVVWFTIPVGDIDRACAFYESTLRVTLRRQQEGPNEIAVFPYEAPAVSGCLLKGEGFQPGTTGSTVYLNADPSLDEAVARAAANGGTVLIPKTEVPRGMGFYAAIRDTEGNTVGLHAIS